MGAHSCPRQLTAHIYIHRSVDTLTRILREVLQEAGCRKNDVGNFRQREGRKERKKKREMERMGGGGVEKERKKKKEK